MITQKIIKKYALNTSNPINLIFTFPIIAGAVITSFLAFVYYKASEEEQIGTSVSQEKEN